MKEKKIPMRTCVLTNEKLPKKELLRVVRTTEGQVVVDITGKVNGRGAYIKKDTEVIKNAKLNNKLSHHLECEIPDSIYNEIINIINSNK